MHFLDKDPCPLESAVDIFWTAPRLAGNDERVVSPQVIDTSPRLAG
jgi:hypothetical protein